VAGTGKATYDIKEATTDPPGSNLVLEKATITGGKILGGSATFGRGHHRDQIYNASGQVGFRTEVLQLREMYVVLFDTLSRRGWLVDGISALLHITSTQVRDRRFLQMCDNPQEVSIRYAHHQRGGDDAFETICKLGNEEITLWEEFTKRTTTKKKDSEGNMVGEPEHLYDTWSLKHQFRENIQTLNKIYAHQARPLSGVDIRLTDRKRLEGWSFRNVVDRPILIEPKTVYLQDDSGGWVEYTRQFHAATLLGANFGELIQPRRHGSQPPCCVWDTVPIGRDLLTVSYTTLREIAEKGGAMKHFPKKVTSDIRWHQAHYLFEPDCASWDGKPPCDRIQELLPLRTVGSIIEPKTEGKLEDAAQPEAYPAAVIFGRSQRTFHFWPVITDRFSHLRARSNEPQMPIVQASVSSNTAQVAREHELEPGISMPPSRSDTSMGDQRTNGEDDRSGSTRATEITPVHSRSTTDGETSRQNTMIHEPKSRKSQTLRRWLANVLHIHKTDEQ